MRGSSVDPPFCCSQMRRTDGPRRPQPLVVGAASCWANRSSSCASATLSLNSHVLQQPRASVSQRLPLSPVPSTSACTCSARAVLGRPRSLVVLACVSFMHLARTTAAKTLAALACSP